MEPITKSFLGDQETWHNARVELDEIHDLWGGKCVTVYGDGMAFVKIVDLSQTEETYRLQLEEERVPELFAALLRNDVLGLEVADQELDPQEICARLSITNAEGETRSVCHWEFATSNERFEEVRNLLSLVHDRMAELGAQLITTVTPDLIERSTSELTFAPSHGVTSPELDPASSNDREDRSSARVLQAISNFFTEDGWSFEQMPDRPILRLPFQGKGGRWNCYAQLRVARDIEQILFYSILPLNVPPERLPAIAEFITRANYGMALGNFELDYNDGEVRYKTSLDVTQVDITPGLLRPLVYTNVLMMDKYMSGLMAVVYADMTPAEAVKQIEG